MLANQMKEESLYAVAQSVGLEPSPDSTRLEDFSEPTFCALCSGTGWELISGNGVRPCGCRTQDHRAKLLKAARVTQRYAECTLQNYYPTKGNGSQLRAFNYAYRLVHEYPIVDRGLLFSGSVGVGKTHLAVAILHGLIEKGIPALFYEYGSLLKSIQASYNQSSHTTEMQILQPVFEAEVLVLDELGALKPTEWALDTIRLIIGTRYSEKKLTIITTNYRDCKNGSQDETLEDRIGLRLRSRLHQMCKTVEVEGGDYRKSFDLE